MSHREARVSCRRGVGTAGVGEELLGFCIGRELERRLGQVSVGEVFTEYGAC